MCQVTDLEKATLFDLSGHHSLRSMQIPSLCQRGQNIRKTSVCTHWSVECHNRVRLTVAVKVNYWFKV